MKSEYSVTMEYREITEYTIKLDDELDENHIDYAYPDQVIDHYEEDPKYIVHETNYFEDGSVASYDNIATCDTYQEAVEFIKEWKEKYGVKTKEL